MALENNKKNSIRDFYTALANEMKAKKQFNVILSDKQAQKAFGLSSTIFIPFDPSEKTDTDGYGLYLFLQEIHTESGTAPCIIAITTLKLADSRVLREVGEVLHELNLSLPIPGWILNKKENLIHYKYIFPINENEKLDTYLALIAEVLMGIQKGFQLIKETVDKNR